MSRLENFLRDLWSAARLADTLRNNVKLGRLLAALSILVGIKSMWKHGELTYSSAAFLVAAILLAALSLIRPRSLSPVTRVWFGFAELAHSFTTPLVLGIAFFLIFTPVAIVRKFFFVFRRCKPQTTYWIVREPPGPDPKSIVHQY